MKFTKNKEERELLKGVDSAFVPVGLLSDSTVCPSEKYTFNPIKRV